MLCFIGACLISFTQGVHSNSVVKKSGSGLCHPPESRWYERTTDFQDFDSVESCLKSGGRLPKGLSETLLADRGKDEAAPTRTDTYTRVLFGHGWADTDSDCQDSRAEALIETSSTPVVFDSSNGCRVVKGRWVSPFTGEVIQNSSSIDIDHVVPLRWAWDHGARTWSDEKRKAFANDPRNLWPVEASLNRSKGARGPTEWLPPAGKCQYIARFLRITKLYGLDSTAPGSNNQKEELRRLLEQEC